MQKQKKSRVGWGGLTGGRWMPKRTVESPLRKNHSKTVIPEQRCQGYKLLLLKEIYATIKLPTTTTFVFNQDRGVASVPHRQQHAVGLSSTYRLQKVTWPKRGNSNSLTASQSLLGVFCTKPKPSFRYQCQCPLVQRSLAPFSCSQTRVPADELSLQASQ